MRKLLAICLILLMTGCAVNNGYWANYKPLPVPRTTDYAPKKYIKTYHIGDISTAFVGQPMIQVKEYIPIISKFTEKIISPENLTINMRWRITNYIINVNAGYSYPITGTFKADNEIFYIIKVPDNNGKSWGILVSEDGSLYKKGIYNYDYEMMFYPREMPTTPNIYKFTIKKAEKEDRGVGAGSYELIFAGKNDVSLNATYREYTSDDLARPSFFQNLTYQANAKQIRFKDFVIKLHDVSNEKITYTILDDGLK